MIYIGIDPGKKGAMAIIYSDGDIHIHLFEDETYSLYLEEIYECELQSQTRCCLERVGPRPKQGVTSTFNFGENYGFIRGLLTAYSIPYELVTPQKWKREFQMQEGPRRHGRGAPHG